MKRRKRAATIVAALGIGVWLALPGTAAALPGGVPARTYPYAPVSPAASMIVTISIDGPDSVGDGLALDVVSWSD